MRKIGKYLLLFGLLLAGWVFFDFFLPIHTDIRRFDSREVAHLETEMWRSYYDRQPRSLFFQMATLLREQYKMPLLKSHFVAYQAAKAAFVFKDGKNRKDYEKALLYLQDFYNEIRQYSAENFDVQKTAALELEWWIVHRERQNHPSPDLADALAELSAEIYHQPAANMQEYAQLRADAMVIRDIKAISGGVSEKDWQKIDSLLQLSWASLSKVVSRK